MEYPLKNRYSKMWSRATPGYIIFLVDQSGSMRETYLECDTKANYAAMFINRIINELININTNGENVRDRVFISIIGYGGSGGDSVDSIRSDYLSQFCEVPLRVEYTKQKLSDGKGGIIEITVSNPIFIEPVANGLTPMGRAFELAKILIECWLSNNPISPAPIVLNISDGLPRNSTETDEEAKAIIEANAIMSLPCKDGNPLIFNTHIGNCSHKYIFNTSENEVLDDIVKFFLKISSDIPESFIHHYLKFGLSLQYGSKGFVSNDPETFYTFFEHVLYGIFQDECCCRDEHNNIQQVKIYPFPNVEEIINKMKNEVKNNNYKN